MDEGRQTTKAISIKQPWASMIARGKKRIETRTWRTNYRGGDLLIVASKRPKIRDPQDARRWLPTGQAIAVVHLVYCRPMVKADEVQACCDIYPRAQAWILASIREIPVPFDVKGQLGLYDVPGVNFCQNCGFRIVLKKIFCAECEAFEI